MLENNKWVKFSLVNLGLVALLGVIMRYKIGFEFPYFDQKHLQHAHSHFAFYGWITHTLMLLMISILKNKSSDIPLKKYNYLLLINLICAYGMFISFSLWGYNAASISFSTAAIITSYVFTIQYIKDIKKIKLHDSSSYWFIASLIFSSLSSLGTFTLAYLMATRNIPQHLYLGSVYFYLHFQYNGWFFFASMGLLNLYLQTHVTNYIEKKYIFWMFALSCIPAYFLSALWIELPMWLYIVVVIASITQFIAWILTLKQYISYFKVLKEKIPMLLFYTFILLAISLTVKFTLQLGSVIPFVSQLAFGFRPIVIAYLHLVLLGIISVFLLTYLFTNHFISLNKNSKIGIIVLISGIYLTEIVLAIQGIASFAYIMVPYMNEALFAIALVMFTGIGILLFSSLKKEIK